MVAYNFQDRFVDPMLSGRKSQTIRRVGRRRHANPGDDLQLYVGLRTKKARLIGRAVCIHFAPIKIDFGARLVEVEPIGARPEHLLDTFAQMDGFDDFDDMRRFWAQTHGLAPFVGVIIMWSNFKSGL